MKKVKLKEVADVNKTTFCINDFDEILYLDTSSVTKGIFDGFIHLSKNDKTPSRAKRAVKDKTIVYSTVRPNLQHFGIFDKPKENVVVSTGFATIDVKDNLADSKFLYYYLTQDKFTNFLHTLATNNVSSYPSINPSDLENLELEIPKEVETQSAIAKVLSSLDDKIELNNKTNKELENLAKTIYEYWFVKQETPKKWQKENLNKYVEIGSGYAFKSDNYTDSGKYKVITIKNVQDNILDLSTVEKTDEIPKNIKEFCILNIGDALMSLTGNVGRMCIVDSENLLLNQRVGKLIVKDKVYFTFLYLFLSSEEQRNRLEQIAGGSSQANLSPIQAVDVLVTIPHISIIQEFNKIVSPIFSKIIKNRQESANLAQLRDFLLPLLMNGEVTTTDIQSLRISPMKQQDYIDDTKFDKWVKQTDLVARGNIDKQVPRSMYEAMDENDR